MTEFQRNDTANSHIIANILLVVIVLILAILVLLLCNIPNLSLPGTPDEPPAIFKITKITSTAPYYKGIIMIHHTGLKYYENDLLSAKIYKDDILMDCRITTLHGGNFVPTNHIGVHIMEGTGCRSNLWYPGQRTKIDVSNGLIRPGDSIRFDVIQKPKGDVISRDTVTV
ncbi:MAG: hypothetical protein U9N40_03700 [Euryarchaeota archaeon]|nr:hypothetical protein [Euryarchaeota archaeon]